MEPILGAFSAAVVEWNSPAVVAAGIHTTTEEADFMAQLLHNCSVDPNEHLHQGLGFDVQSTLLGSYFNNDDNNTNSFDFLQGGSSYSTGTSSSSVKLFQNDSSQQERYYLNGSNPIVSMDYHGMTDAAAAAHNANTYLIEVDDNTCLNKEMSDDNANDVHSAKNQTEPTKNALQNQMESSEMQTEKPAAIEDEGYWKRSRSSSNVQKNKRNVRSKKNQKIEDAGINAAGSCCSENDDLSGSQELNSGGASSSLNSKGNSALNLHGKTRASRGAATDPQSLYARKRRERINERLRTLQNLVPNGTKVDISTMLEEAVRYVKFLQLQIKLLSSDDLWMYAPIAYNGMNIGVDLKIPDDSKR